MRVTKLYLENFLSYKKLFCEFEDGLNVLIGHNAAGKTNLVEGIFYCSVGKSARGLKDKELLCWDGEGSARIRMQVARKFASHTIDVFIDGQGKKRITIDGLPISRMGELMGVVNTVYFSPDEMKLIKDSPVDRRRFMDMSLCQRDKLYFYKLTEYNKLLSQRNKLLKNYKENPAIREMSDIIVAKMVDAECYIVAKRKEFVESIAPLANRRHNVITGGKEDLGVEYETEDIDFNDVEGSLKKLYTDSFDKDRKLEYTTVGIHRDDLKIIAGGIDVRKYGSQGQQRTSVLSLKLAEVDSFYNAVGEYPILILDDVASELDADRQKALFDGLNGVQTIVTATDVKSDFGAPAVFEIKDRNVTKKQ